MKLQGKTALVTGASSGLGAHFARVLAGQGAQVTCAARRVDRLETLVAEIGNGARTVAMDVTDAASVKAGFDQPYDIVINNAGVTYDGPALKTAEDDWNWVINTDLNGVFRVAQAAGQALVEAQRPGTIVNIASILGLRVAGNLSAPMPPPRRVSLQMTKKPCLGMGRATASASTRSAPAISRPT